MPNFLPEAPLVGGMIKGCIANALKTDVVPHFWQPIPMKSILSFILTSCIELLIASYF
jgi:hypothetical protein